MTLDLPTLTRLAKGASPGPWGYDLNHTIAQQGDDVEWGPTIAQIPGDKGVGRGAVSIQDEANAVYIAALSPEVVLALIERLEKAEKDTARLDWLENKQPVIEEWKGAPQRLFYLWRDAEKLGFGTSLRSAIDSANPSPEASQP